MTQILFSIILTRVTPHSRKLHETGGEQADTDGRRTADRQEESGQIQTARPEPQLVVTNVANLYVAGYCLSFNERVEPILSLL